MSKNFITGFLLSALIFVLMTSAVNAAVLPAVVSSVKIDDQTVTSGSTTRLNIERDQPFEVRMVLSSQESLSNVEVQAFVSGYEHNDVERVFESTPVFDMAANVSYTKRITLRLPTDANADNYKLRLVIADRNNDALVQNYDLRLDAPRHLLRVDDVSLFSAGHGNQVVAGDPVLANVRIKNLGEQNEQDVKVRFTVPELGLIATKYIDSIRSDKSEETGNMYLKLPQCAAPGMYGVNVDVSYDDSTKTLSDKSQTLTVLKNEICDKKEEPKTIVVEVVRQPEQPVQPTIPAVDAQNAEAGNSVLAKIRSALEIFLVVLFAIFIVIGIIVFFSRLMKNPEDDE